MPFNEELPEWNQEGAEPSQEKKDNGFAVLERPPAGLFDWFFNRTSRALRVFKDLFNNHEKDYVSHTGFAVTTGTATAYTITLNPVPAELKQGMGIKIKPHIASGSNPTIKINDNKPIPIIGTMKANTIYQLFYDGASFVVQGGDESLRNDFNSHLEDDATITKKGHVQLSNAITSNDETKAATSKAVKIAYDKANEAFTLGNSRKQQMVDGLLSINPGLPITHNSTWEEINDVLLSGNVNVGKVVSGTITAENNTSFFLPANGGNPTSASYVNFDTNMLDFVPDFILFTRTDKSSNDIDGWFLEDYYAPTSSSYGNSKRGSSVFRVPYVQGILKIPVPAPNAQFNFRAVKER